MSNIVSVHFLVGQKLRFVRVKFVHKGAIYSKYKSTQEKTKNVQNSHCQRLLSDHQLFSLSIYEQAFFFFNQADGFKKKAGQ